MIEAGVTRALKMLRADLVTMERCSVGVRYLGEMAEKEDAQSVFAAAGTVRTFVRQKIGAK
jgi:hypothetical protein